MDSRDSAGRKNKTGGFRRHILLSHRSDAHRHLPCAKAFRKSIGFVLSPRTITTVHECHLLKNFHCYYIIVTGNGQLISASFLSVFHKCLNLVRITDNCL